MVVRLPAPWTASFPSIEPAGPVFTPIVLPCNPTVIELTYHFKVRNGTARLWIGKQILGNRPFQELALKKQYEQTSPETPSLNKDDLLFSQSVSSSSSSSRANIQPLQPDNFIGISCEAAPCESVRVSVSWTFPLYPREFNQIPAPPSPPAVSPSLAPASPSTSPAESTSSGGLTTGAIAGIGALAAAVLISITIAILYLVQRTRRGRPVPDDESKTSMDLHRRPQRLTLQSISMSVSTSEQVEPDTAIGTPIHDGGGPWKHSNNSTSTLSVLRHESDIRTPTSQDGPWRDGNTSTLSIGQGSSLPRLTGMWTKSKTSLGRSSERSEGESDYFGKTVSAQVAPGASESTLRNPSTPMSFGRYFEDESLPRNARRSEGRRRSGTSENSGRSVTSMFSWRRFGEEETPRRRSEVQVTVSKFVDDDVPPADVVSVASGSAGVDPNEVFVVATPPRRGRTASLPGGRSRGVRLVRALSVPPALGRPPSTRNSSSGEESRPTTLPRSSFHSSMVGEHGSMSRSSFTTQPSLGRASFSTQPSPRLG
ncbi:hypothetical protein BJ742DRAFT_351365 [Cladochytrium replicatum]|nr:hypothetical protein BJ742DRAFT_351365 [Cladochytrium replicatum]